MSSHHNRTPDVSTLHLNSDGGKVWEDCWKVKEYSEERFKEVREEIRVLTGDSAPEGMCQGYKITQPQRRKVNVYTCTYYAANKKTSKLRKGLIWTGIITGAVAVAGLTIITGGALGAIGTPALLAAGNTIATVGTGASGLAFAGTGLVAPGDSIKDYERGPLKEIKESVKPDEWQDYGTTREQTVGEPFPCVE